MESGGVARNALKDIASEDLMELVLLLRRPGY